MFADDPYMTGAWEAIVKNTDSKVELFHAPSGLDAYMISLEPDTSLPLEKHHGVLQFFLVLSGSGEAFVEGNDGVKKLAEHSMFHVPPEKLHTVSAKGEGLKMLTFYSSRDHATRCRTCTRAAIGACPKCKVAKYCSRECQIKDYKSHDCLTQFH